MLKNSKFALYLLIFGVTGCASMYGDNTRQVSVNSEPEGANVYINGKNYGTTPTTVTLPTYVYGGMPITVKKDGYVDQDVQINAQFQTVGLWNILNFPIGFIIDSADGDAIKLDPDSTKLSVKLQPQIQSNPNVTSKL